MEVTDNQYSSTQLSSMYEALLGEREAYLQRSRECAKLTIPMVAPPEGASQASSYFTPFQSVGARGVNNLASKLLLTLLLPFLDSL